MGSSESAAWTAYDSAVTTAGVAWVQTVAADEAFQNTAIAAAQVGAEATAATGAITALALIDTAWVSQVAGAEVLWRTTEAAAEVNRIAAIGTAATAAEQRLGNAAEAWAQTTWPAWATFVADVSQADADRQQEIALAAADHEKTAAAAHVPYVQNVTAAAVIHTISAAEAEGAYHVVMVGLQVDRAVAGAALHVAYVNEQAPASFAWIEPNGGLDYEGPASGGDDAWLDQLKTMSDTAGLIDPTIFSDGVSALISLYQGNYGEAVLSVLAMPPVLGVMARGGRYAGKITRAVNKSRVVFEGMEVRAVRSLSHVDESTLRAMSKKGFAAKDINGKSLHLHHLRQKPAGPLVEIPVTRHNVHNRIQHPLGNAPGTGLTVEQRAAFDAYRVNYWKARALEELLRRGLMP